MTTVTKANLVKIKTSGQDGSSKGKFDAAMIKKKIESSSKQPVDAKQKSVSTVLTKTEVKSKTSSSSSKATTTTKTKVREKKVYNLPGQKHDPPEEREPLRIFYESLWKQIPTSEMAEFWTCLRFYMLDRVLGSLTNNVGNCYSLERESSILEPVSCCLVQA